jgi:hypothetical protein
MFRKNTFISSLQTRKKLLLAESDVNRAELVKDLNALKGEVNRVKKNIRTVGSIASSAALLATAVSVFRQRFTPPQDSNGAKKRSWVRTALAGARIGTSLFLKIRSIIRERERE